MKKIKILVSFMFVILIIILTVMSYYIIVDIESNVPKEIQETCKIKKYNFMNRSIFVINSKTEIENKKVILYFHGGSYMAEASKKHWEFISHLVNDTNTTIIMPDYPLAPKYDYEDVYKMVIPLYKELIKKIDTNNLIMMGDSAGGGICLALEEKIGEENISMPSQTILISPWLDVRLQNPEIKKYEERDKILNKETLRLAGIEYSKEDMDNYLVNPIDGNLSKLKNVIILIGTEDILNPDVKLLRKKAKEQGSEIEVKEYEGALHIWIIEKNSSKELVDEGYNEIINLINNLS